MPAPDIRATAAGIEGITRYESDPPGEDPYLPGMDLHYRRRQPAVAPSGPAHPTSPFARPRSAAASGGSPYPRRSGRGPVGPSPPRAAASPPTVAHRHMATGQQSA